MSKYLKLVCLLSLVFLMGCSSAAPKAGQGQGSPSNSLWQVIYRTKVDQPVRLAAFMDESFGFTGGANNEGRAYLTTDGGQTWTMSPGSSGCLFSLDVIDKDVVWECNYSDVRPSVDGGKTWLDKMRGMGQPGCTVTAVDRNTAWHLTPSVFEMTNDGGATRTPVNFPEGVSSSNVAAISLRTAQDGYLLDSDGNLYITADAGQTWAKRAYLSLKKFDPMTLLPYKGLPYAAIRFTDKNHGLVALSLMGGGSSKVVLMRTKNGGQTWSEEEAPTTIGQPYISHDGMYLTMTSILSFNEVTLLKYTGKK